MLVHKCDKCGKIMPDRYQMIEIEIGDERHEFCAECGARVTDAIGQILSS